MKPRLFILLVVVFGFLVCGAVAVWHFFLRPERLDFDKLGGTILVYEIDLRDRDADADLAQKMAEALQRRLDPDERSFASVVPLGKNRVEIRVPRTDDERGTMATIKDLIGRVGSLEFRMLANIPDDAAAIADARRWINSFADRGDVAAELKDAQERGLPPPALRDPNDAGKKAKKYEIRTTKQIKSAVTYSWIELGPTERKALNLDNAARTDATRNAAWLAAQKRRGQAVQLPESADDDGRLLLRGALFYSRECKDLNLPEKDRRWKEFEYFVLARDPEFVDLTSEERTPKVDGSYLVNARAITGPDGRPTVAFDFNADGGKLFGNLTRKNISEDDGPSGTWRIRHLAIVLDGMVMSAPTINSEIRTRGQITGNFTDKEVDALVNILRAGALPAPLKPWPVSETQVPPKAR